uniref:Uncharacterized protein n=1 Tax=Meloidogyne enterolobii TaxID=390850 RepID=A0A6V7WZW7_MELEN|nr:unnamed protein product [Meloidogyne enterolobii]
MILGTFIGHVLLLERILATVFVSRYENNKKPYFSIFCFIILMFLSFQNAYRQTYYGDSVFDVALGTLITIYGTLFFGLLEIAIIGYIGYYNNTKYKLKTYLYFKHSLSERYQLSENIRTSRQLKPTFVLHFINIIISSGVTIVLSFIHLKDQTSLNLIFVFVFLITACCNLSIQITVIIFHPILNKQFKQLLKKLQNKILKVPSTKIVPSDKAPTSLGQLPLNIDGGNLIIKENTELCQKHFEMLKKAWE